MWTLHYPKGQCFPKLSALAVAAGAGVAAVAFTIYRLRRRVQEQHRATVVAQRLRARTTTRLSERLSLPVGKEGVDLSGVDVAGLINNLSDETGYEIEAGGKAGFNRTWRRAMRPAFVRNGNVNEFEEWMCTGKSNGRELIAQVMCLPPNMMFRCHFHPNIEFELTLSGALYENKMKGVPDITIEDTGNEGPERLKSVPPKLSDLSPDKLMFENGVVPAGECLANAVHSMHQSFTKDEGALILVLWSGQHCNIRPENCEGVSDMLVPGAGWAL